MRVWGCVEGSKTWQFTENVVIVDEFDISVDISGEKYFSFYFFNYRKVFLHRLLSIFSTNKVHISFRYESHIKSISTLKYSTTELFVNDVLN